MVFIPTETIVVGSNEALFYKYDPDTYLFDGFIYEPAGSNAASNYEYITETPPPSNVYPNTIGNDRWYLSAKWDVNELIWKETYITQFEQDRVFDCNVYIPAGMLGINDAFLAPTTDKFRVNGKSSFYDTLISYGAVGIGTGVPEAALHVQGTALINDATTMNGTVVVNNRLTLKPDNSNALLVLTGNVGIGVSDATCKLDVDGSVKINSNLTVNGDFTVQGTQTIINTDVQITDQIQITNAGTGPALVVNQTGAQPVLDFQDDGTSIFTMINGGNIGIRTPTPQCALHVKGNILGLPIMAILRDIKAAGTSGGTSVVGWQKRTLNTIAYDTIGITLSYKYEQYNNLSVRNECIFTSYLSFTNDKHH
jgi:hypothetical protein